MRKTLGIAIPTYDKHISYLKDLLDLISDTGSESDVNFLKEKIEATKDLISLLQ